MTGGPSDRGLDFQNDADFTSAGIGVGNNNYLALISGSFNAKTAGNYNWEIPGNDDRGAFWIDLDRNGIFELDGQQGVEKILDASGDFVSKTVNLSPNLYQIALIHGESTGESSQKLMFSAPSLIPVRRVRRSLRL